MKSPGADNTYVVFGEAKIQDFSNFASDQEATKFSAKEQPVAADKAPVETKAEAEESKGGEDDDNEEGLSAETIEAVMSHTKKSRREVVKALRETNGDSVTAILVHYF